MPAGAEARTVEVVDLKRLWVEAYAYDVAAMSKVIEANARSVTGATYHLKFAAVRWLANGELDPSFAEGGIFSRRIGDYGSASAVALATTMWLSAEKAMPNSTSRLSGCTAARPAFSRTAAVVVAMLRMVSWAREKTSATPSTPAASWGRCRPKTEVGSEPTTGAAGSVST